MLVQALAAYADTYLKDQMEDSAFESKPVPLVLEISPEGRFLGWIPREESVMRGKKAVKQIPLHAVPRSPVNRNSGAHPLLGFDDAKYVFGTGPWTKDGQTKDHQQKHVAFVELLKRATEATADDSLAACVRFYEQADQVALAKERVDEKVTGILLSVSPEGPVINRPLVRAYWQEHFRREFGVRNEVGGEGCA